MQHISVQQMLHFHVALLVLICLYKKVKTKKIKNLFDVHFCTYQKEETSV